MRKFGAVAAFAMSMLVSSVTLAADALKPEDKMVCKRRQETGTRFFAKVCRTARQWEEMAEQHRRALGEMADRPQIEIRR